MKTSYFHSSQLILAFLLVFSLGFISSCSSSEESNDSATVAPDNSSTDNSSTTTTDNSSTATTDNSSASASGSATSTTLPPRTTPVQFGTSNNDFAQDIAVSTSGNIYITGATEGSMDGQTNRGGKDAFVVKYDSSGSKQWVKQFGTIDNESGYGVALDSSENIYITGFVSGVKENGSPGSVGYYKQTYAKNVFTVKYNTSGVQQWRQELASGSGNFTYSEVDASGNTIAVDHLGNVYVTGYTDVSLDNNTNAGGADIFLVKYNTSGIKEWTQQFGSTSGDYGSGVAVDHSGNVYVTGYTWGDFAGYTMARDVFVMKLNTSGVQQWVKQLFSSVGEFAYSIAVDSSGNAYITGETQGTFISGASPSSRDNMMIVKYDSSGTQQWVKQLEVGVDMGRDVGRDIILDASGYFYVTGQAYGGQGSGNIVLAKYDLSGTEQWVKQCCKGSTDSAYGIAVDASGNPYVTGYTDVSLSGNPQGGFDGFILKYDNNGKKVW